MYWLWEVARTPLARSVAIAVLTVVLESMANDEPRPRRRRR